MTSKRTFIPKREQLFSSYYLKFIVLFKRHQKATSSNTTQIRVLMGEQRKYQNPVKIHNKLKCGTVAQNYVPNKTEKTHHFFELRNAKIHNGCLFIVHKIHVSEYEQAIYYFVAFLMMFFFLQNNNSLKMKWKKVIYLSQWIQYATKQILLYNKK